ncbi:hypothetical protein PHYSODRAFT_437329, partial [Phytophthora sojae]
QLRRKEAEWMAEYDRGVQALLKIVQHHESETAQLKAEVEKLRTAAAVVPPSITKMTRATQTESARPVRATPRRNSVRFAPNEDCAVTDKEEVDPRTKIKIARMQVNSTQTEEIPVLASSAKLQQDLEDRNRLLHERLTSQQNMLDQLLHTKLTHANASSAKRERGPVLNTPADMSQRSHPHKQCVWTNSTVVYNV